MTQFYSPFAATNTALRLEAGGSIVDLPISDAVLIGVSPVLTPLPLAASPVEGMSVIEGFPVVQIDLGLVLTGRPGAGQVVAVVRHGNSRVAFRVDRVSLAAGNVLPSPELSSFLQSFIPAIEAAGLDQAVQPRARHLQIIVLTSHGRFFGVPAVSIERVDRVTKRTEMHSASGLALTLVLLNNEALPSCSIPSRLSVDPAHEEEVNWGVVVKPSGERLVWTAASVLGLQTIAFERIRSIAIPNDTPVVWYESEQGDFVELIDPEGVLTGLCSTPPVTKEFNDGFRSDLQLRSGPFCFLLPTVMTGKVLESVISGLAEEKTAHDDMPVVNAARLFGFSGESNPRRGIVVTLEAGERVVLAVEYINAVSVGKDSEIWPLPTVPAEMARFIDGVMREESSTALIYRLRAFSVDSILALKDQSNNVLMGWLPAHEISCF